MEIEQLKNITPFREIHGGEESIYDLVDPGFVLPAESKAYLQYMGKCIAAAPGIFAHPFFEEKILDGPYLMSDGVYIWDSNAAELADKFHVRLPDEFIVYTLSERAQCAVKEKIQKGLTNEK